MLELQPRCQWPVARNYSRSVVLRWASFEPVQDSSDAWSSVNV